MDSGSQAAVTIGGRHDEENRCSYFADGRNRSLGPGVSTVQPRGRQGFAKLRAAQGSVYRALAGSPQSKAGAAGAYAGPGAGFQAFGAGFLSPKFIFSTTSEAGLLGGLTLSARTTQPTRTIFN